MEEYFVSSTGYEVEMCPHCEQEVKIRWNVNKDGFKAYCPHCGKRLMLCNACQHRYGESCDDCDYCGKTDTCRFNKNKEETDVTDTMRKILEETERVNKLDAEVKKAVSKVSAETGLCRAEKLREIEAFLREMTSAMKTAGVNEYIHVTCCGDNPNVDKYEKWKWPLGVSMGSCYFGIGEFNVMMHFSRLHDGDIKNAFIDRFSEDDKRKIESAVVEKIEQTLRKRMDQMTADLKKANEEHAVYFGREE